MKIFEREVNDVINFLVYVIEGLLVLQKNIFISTYILYLG